MYFRSFVSIIGSIFFSISLIAQEQIYRIDFKQEIILLGGGIGLNVLGAVLTHNVEIPTIDHINALNRSYVWAFDRGATNNNSSNAKSISDIILYAGAALPIITYLTHNHKDEGAKIGIMALETFLLTNGLTSMTKGAVKRYRPFNYNPEVSIESKLTRNARWSFFSGHASNTAAFSFFSAKVLIDLYPDMKNKFLIWATAAAIPATISYLRYDAGRHFPTDLIVGYAVGASIGYLLPSIHMSKNVKLDISGTGSMSLYVRLNRKK